MNPLNNFKIPNETAKVGNLKSGRMAT